MTRRGEIKKKTDFFDTNKKNLKNTNSLIKTKLKKKKKNLLYFFFIHPVVGNCDFGKSVDMSEVDLNKATDHHTQ